MCSLKTKSFLRFQILNYTISSYKDNNNHKITITNVLNVLFLLLRFGKPFVIDMFETEMFETIKEKLDEILPGLLDMVLDKSIIKDEK